MPFHNLSFLLDVWNIFIEKLLAFVTDFKCMTYGMEAAWIVRRVPGDFSNLKSLIYSSCQK